MQNNDSLRTMISFGKELCIILQCFIIYEDDGNSIEHPPGYEYLGDDYSIPSLDEEKGR